MTASSQTPILDREQPLPPPRPARGGMHVVIVVWGLILAAAAAGVATGHPPAWRRFVLHDVPAWAAERGVGIAAVQTLLALLAITLVMLAFHEGGHALGGLAAGFRFESLRIGPLKLDRRNGLTLHRRLLDAYNGVAVMAPDSTERLAQRGRLLLWGGPVANVVSGALVLLTPVARGPALLGFAIMSVLNGLSDLLPYRSRLGVSDGRCLWALYRHPARGERWLALMRLQIDLTNGVLPEALPAEFIDKAVAVRDDSIDTVAAHAFAFSSAFHRRADDEAARMLETCLATSPAAPVALRTALIADAGVFQARRRGRADLAEGWLSELPAAGAPEQRARVEAAIRQARGDRPGALEKLAELERATAAEPDPVRRELLLRLLERWRAELAEQ